MDSDNLKKEFKVFNFTIDIFSFLYGIFFIVCGFFISILTAGSIFSYLAIKFISKKKLFMHIVVLFGLIIFLGGLDLIRSLINGSAFENIWADTSKLMMLLTGFYFTLQCVRSFIFARKNR